jgi:hypothetical protein
MEFLLLLSAMLTALTGAITGVRAPEVPVQQVAGAARVAQVAEKLAETAVRPSSPVVATLPDFEAIYLTASPRSDVPLYADRLRE